MQPIHNERHAQNKNRHSQGNLRSPLWFSLGSRKQGPKFQYLAQSHRQKEWQRKGPESWLPFPIGVRPHIHSIYPNRRGDLTARPLLWASSLLRSPPLSSHHHLLVTREPHLSHFRSSVWASGEESHNSLDKLAHVLLRPGCRIIKQALEATGRINTLFGDGEALSN